MTSSDSPGNKAASGSGTNTTPSQAPARPGDEAPAGTPGTGEGLCPRCGGSGKVDGQECPECKGTGHTTQGIGGA